MLSKLTSEPYIEVVPYLYWFCHSSSSRSCGDLVVVMIPRSTVGASDIPLLCLCVASP